MALASEVLQTYQERVLEGSEDLHDLLRRVDHLLDGPWAYLFQRMDFSAHFVQPHQMGWRSQRFLSLERLNLL